MKLWQLISTDYLEEQRRMHADPRGYGTKGRKWADYVEMVAEKHEMRGVILDYGCGANTLAEELNARGYKTRSYDPAVEQFAKMPKPSEMVVCTDVLEHVEPEKIDGVLTHIASVMLQIGFFVISTVETDKILSDGRNAHICLHERDWWLAKLARRFRKIETVDDPELHPERQLVVIVRAKER